MKVMQEFMQELILAFSTSRRGATDLIASRIPPGRVVLVGELFGCGSALLSCGVAGFTLCSL